MKNYLRKICSITLFALFAYPLNIANAKDRDPFSPTSGNMVKSSSVTISSEDEDNSNLSSNPLTSSKLSGYKIIGTITSNKIKVATIKSLSGVDYTIKIGERLGSEGGRVKDITHKGVKVSNSKNSSFLPVSNKIEVNVEE